MVDGDGRALGRPRGGVAVIEHQEDVARAAGLSGELVVRAFAEALGGANPEGAGGARRRLVGSELDAAGRKAVVLDIVIAEGEEEGDGAFGDGAAEGFHLSAHGAAAGRGETEGVGQVARDERERCGGGPAGAGEEGGQAALAVREMLARFDQRRGGALQVHHVGVRDLDEIDRGRRFLLGGEGSVQDADGRENALRHKTPY